MGIKHLGQAVFIDDDPIQPADWKKALPGAKRKRWGTAGEHAVGWFERMASEEGLSIHPYAEFMSLERAEIGLALIKDGKETVDSHSLKTVYYAEPMVRYTEASMLEGDEKSWAFEEEPFVEVTDKKDWQKLLESHTSAYGELRKEYEYEGPGLYDARDMSKGYDSVEEYELSYMEDEASNLVDYIFSGGLMPSDLHGEEWVRAFEKLAIRAAGDEGEEEEEES